MAASLDKSSAPLPAHDIFGTPENEVFLSTNPYSALAKNKKEIRLLQVLPEDQEGMIACTLQQSRLLSEIQGQYVALSYCAGDPRNTKEIIVNGAVCNVFANLEHALNEARYFWKQTHRDEDLIMWVDQICINQMDLGERSHQVGFMRDIYEKSRQVLVCLSIKASSARGMQWLQRVIDEIQILRPNPEDPRAMKPLVERLREATKDNEEYVKEWSAFWDVVKSPWWTRAWIFQEFIVAPSAIFLHSHQHVTWERLHSAMPVLIYFQPADDDPTPHVQRAFLPMMEVEGVHPTPYSEMVTTLTEHKTYWTGVQDLKALLLRSRNTSASNPRDKIYAVIGLADPGYNIIPNYSLSISEVLIETTRRIIEFENSLTVLFFAPEKGQNLHLPSWVVDWTRPGSNICLVSPQISPPRPGNATPRIEFQMSTGGGLALVVRGVFIGSLSAGRAFFSLPGSQQMYSTTIATLYQPQWAGEGKRFELHCYSGVEDLDELWVLQNYDGHLVLRRSSHGYILISQAFVWTVHPRSRPPNGEALYEWTEQAQSDPTNLQRIWII